MMRTGFSKYLLSLTIIPFSALIFFTSCGGSKKTDPASADAPIAVTGLVVKHEDAQDQLLVPGDLLAMDEVTLMPEVAGRVVKLDLPEGARVKKGTLLVKLFDDDLQAELKKYQEQLKTAEATEARQKTLLDAGGMSQTDYDQTVNTVNTLKAEIDGVNADIRKTEIRAPFDGIIGLRNISEGAYVSAGTAIASFQADQKMKLDFTVPEIYAALISKGMEVSFHLDGDTLTYHADVLASESNVSGDALDVRIRAIVKESNTKLIPGSSASVELALANRDSALFIPSQALIAKGSKYSVIISRNGKAEIKTATTGIRTSTEVEITSGLNAGDTVVTTGLQFIKTGNSLRFTSVK